MQTLVCNSKAFEFVKEEEDLYSLEDLKEKFQMEKGDIILIPFPFTDLSGNKNRPALVLVSGELDITVCFISTQLKWKEETDILLKPNEENGLHTVTLSSFQSLLTPTSSL